MLYDELGNYTAAFLAAGIPPIIGASLLFLIYWMPGSNTAIYQADDAERETEAGGVLATDAEQQPEEVQEGDRSHEAANVDINGGIRQSETKTTVLSETGATQDETPEDESLLKSGVYV